MKYYILLAFFIFCSCCRAFCQIYDGFANDSVVIRFTDAPVAGYVQDTATVPLWQIGRTHKSFFATDTSGTVTIMTDTLSHYPINANNWFILKFHFCHLCYPIVGFWHRYQTDSAHDGGIVEFSVDEGATWENVKGYCNQDSATAMGATWEIGVHTENFYTFADTITGGMPAFTGNYTNRFSRFQFLGEPAPKSASGQWFECLFRPDTMYIRFRFVSDTTADTLAGWMIDSVKIEHDTYAGGYVHRVQQTELSPHPNPSFNGRFMFPSLKEEKAYHTVICNALGQRVYTQPFSREVNLFHLPVGVYYYHISDGETSYRGKLHYLK